MVAVKKTFLSRSPSIELSEVGLFANPKSKSARISQLPDWSPVNIRPVLFPPCAAGAKPMNKTFGSRSPNPGTGFPQ